jgi:hypothetical protein
LLPVLEAEALLEAALALVEMLEAAAERLEATVFAALTTAAVPLAAFVATAPVAFACIVMPDMEPLID